jgi:N-acetylmuramoyl-L-alanine amidase
MNGKQLPTRIATWVGLGLSLLLLSGCAIGPYGTPGDRLERKGDEIVVAGQLFHTGAPVVLWTDPGGYDAYRAHRHFEPDEWMPSRPVSDDPVRYGSFRKHLPTDVAQQVRDTGWDLETLQEHVDQFVMHYDVCGTSAKCFEVLQDLRGLSVHFMLDLDGTIYQTLDLKERAWHAGKANDRSVGIEIANMGAYRDPNKLETWYAHDDDGRPFITYVSDGSRRTGHLDPDFMAYPSRAEPVTGTINGSKLQQYDLTDEQYDSLIKLVATVCMVLPEIEPDYPRDAEGNLVNNVLSKDELDAYSGLIGHYHITKVKVDPGPAFDWDRVTDGARRLMR